MENSKFKILLVDDNPTNIKILSNVLHVEKYNIGSAGNGKDALEILRNEGYDLILLDVNMPEMDGFKVCEIIRNTPLLNEIPIIFLTGETELESIVNGFKAGGQDYIKKPFNAPELLARVKTHLELKEKRKELKTLNESLEHKVYERTKELLAAKEKAEMMNRLKSNFLANMSHELRTPLIAINGFATLMKEELDDSELLYMTDGILRSGLRLSDTLNLILDLSQIESEKIDFKFEHIELVLETLEIIQSFESAAKKKGLILESKFCKSTIYINTDRRAYRTILHNLINNAVKFSNKGKVSVELLLVEDNVELTVTDTGIGIPKEFHQTIFDEFRQVSEGITRNFEGTGLGLSITKTFVEKFGGNIWVESEAGFGSKFFVRLPVELFPTDGDESANEEHKSIDAQLKKSERKPPALLIDDEPNIYPILKRFVSEYIEIETISEGELAIQLCKEKQYSVIFMDINLRAGMDGIETTKEIRKLNGYGSIPIIATTAYAMAGDKTEFLAAGCSHYLVKPFSKKEVLKLLGEIL